MHSAGSLFVVLSALVLGAVGFDNSRYDNVSVVFSSAQVQYHPYYRGSVALVAAFFTIDAN